MEYVVVLTTTPIETEATALARSLVEARLAACVQIQPIRSIYRWKGEILDEPEWRMLVKTRADRYTEVEQHIRERHSYETPQIVCIKLDAGLPSYLLWIDENTVPSA